MHFKFAGPTLRALVAATVNRMLLQNMPPFDRGLGDPRCSGPYRYEVDRIALTTTDHMNVVEEELESCVTWELTHPLWILKVVEKRRLKEHGTFERVAPYQISLEGDLMDAARLLGIPPELFFAALRADGWTATEVTIERLRWIDAPCLPLSAKTQLLARLL